LCAADSSDSVRHDPKITFATRQGGSLKTQAYFDPTNTASVEPSVAVFGGRGGGALAAFTLRRLQAVGRATCVGFLNDMEAIGARIAGYPVLGPFTAWPDLPVSTQFIAPLHKAKQMRARAELIRGLGVPRDRWATLIDPQAILADDVSCGVGLLAAAGCSILSSARIGDHVAVRNGAHVAHDCTVGDLVMIGVNAVMCGYCTVLEGAHIAPGAVVRDGITVGCYSVVGLGAVVVEDVPDRAIVAGNPARIIGSVDDPISAATAAE
jgi:sugar O-acyltransferase (sialic acid O-acetyltransferase NeuD family)